MIDKYVGKENHQIKRHLLSCVNSEHAALKADGFRTATMTNEHLFLDSLIYVTMCISYKSFDLINHSTHLARSSPAPGSPLAAIQQ